MAVVYSHRPAAASHGDQVRELIMSRQRIWRRLESGDACSCNTWLCPVHCRMARCVSASLHVELQMQDLLLQSCCSAVWTCLAVVMISAGFARHLKATTSAPTVLMAEHTEAAMQRQVRTPHVGTSTPLITPSAVCTATRTSRTVD